MKILALIPARGGSKRLPGKNIKILGDKPLIAWTILAAKESGVCADIWVSTDDSQIAAVSSEWGASVPFIRDEELAGDFTSSVDVTLDALKRYEQLNGEPDGVLLLQPTSPFRTSNLIRQAVEVFKQNGAQRTVVSVNAVDHHPAWCFEAVDGRLVPFLGWEALKKRSQELPAAFALNGSIYLINPYDLKKNKSFFSSDMIPLFMTRWSESIDIDTPEDWMIAESNYNNSIKNI